MKKFYSNQAACKTPGPPFELKHAHRSLVYWNQWLLHRPRSTAVQLHFKGICQDPNNTSSQCYL